MKPCVLAVLLTTFALTLPGCKSTPASGTLQPTLLAYWEGEEAWPRCPPSEEYDCVSIVAGKKRLIQHRAEQRKHGLRIVRFDAYVDRSNELYAAAWEKSEQEHVFEMAMDWKEFSRTHRKNTDKGYRLVHLRVYTDGRRQRVAAIWREPSDSEAGLPPARVVFHHTFFHLDEVAKSLRKKGFYLASFDVYPRLDDPELHYVAAVFRYGNVEAEFRPVSHVYCLPSVEPIVPIPSESEQETPQTCSVNSDPEEYEDVCPFAGTLQTTWDEGLRPVGFESYWEDDEGHIVALLHRRETPADWLMVPAVKGAVDCRHGDLNRSTPDGADGAAEEELGFNLVDLDLLVEPTQVQQQLRGSSGDRLRLFPEVETPLHNGLVHDGGTAGPP